MERLGFCLLLPETTSASAHSDLKRSKATSVFNYFLPCEFETAESNRRDRVILPKGAFSVKSSDWLLPPTKGRREKTQRPI